MDGTNPRAVIGDNAPPLADRLAIDHAALVKEADEVVALVPADLRAIETEEEAGAYTETAADIKSLIEKADAAFEAEKKPWRDGAKTVDDFFRFRADLTAAAKRAVSAINVWGLKKLADERKAQIARDAEAAKAAALFDEEPPAPTAPIVPREAARVVAASGAKASGALKWKGRVIDFEKVPRQYLMINETALNAAVAGLKAQGGKIEDAKIPGVEIYEDLQTSIRR